MTRHVGGHCEIDAIDPDLDMVQGVTHAGPSPLFPCDARHRVFVCGKATPWAWRSEIGAPETRRAR